MAVFWVVAPCSLVKFYQTHGVSEVLAASIIALMMEAARTSETLVNFYQTTWRYNPEDSHLHITDLQRGYYTFTYIHTTDLENVSEYLEFYKKGMANIGSPLREHLDMTTKVVENNSDSRTSSCLNVS
jgi:hypothetical protein